MKAIKRLTVGLAGLAIVACSNSGTLPASSSASTGAGGFGGGNDPAGNAASTSGLGGNAGGSFERFFPGATQQELELLQNNLVVYFEFDSSEIRSDFNPMLAAHASYLASSPDVSVRLEGHADERGSREYNIGLGERRAQAVRQILSLQGVTSTQLSTVSYGEERPAAFGSDEESYGLNRRVELVYR